MATEGFSAEQIEAFKHICDSFIRNINPICALGTGLGKTWVACETIKHIINGNNDNYRILIIHKATNHDDPWISDLKKCKIITDNNKSNNTHSGHIYIHEKKDRERNVHNGKYIFPKRYVLLTTYDTLCLDLENSYYDYNFDLIIFDELHTIINHKKFTKRSKYILKAEKN